MLLFFLRGFLSRDLLRGWELWEKEKLREEDQTEKTPEGTAPHT